MTRLRMSVKRQPRRGFTLIELLVVISIIAVLASLIAPAVQSARRSARKLECLNNIRQVGIAIQSISSNTGGQLPNLTSDVPVNSGYLFDAAWPVALLPALDATAVLKNIKANATGTTPSFAINTTERIWIPALTCPDDADSFRQPGGLSYVLNSGYIPSTIWGLGESTTLRHQQFGIDWNANSTFSANGLTATGDTGDSNIQVATRVFFHPYNSANVNNLLTNQTVIAAIQSSLFTSSLDYIGTGDGQSSTLMIAENLNAGPWAGPTSQPGYGVNTLGFGIAIPVDSGTGAVQTGPFAGTSSLKFNIGHTGGFSDPSVVPDAWTINRPLASGTVIAPRPSSSHPGGVNVVFCDGSARYLNEQMDKVTYAKLLTSNGVNFGEQTLDSRGF